MPRLAGLPGRFAARLGRTPGRLTCDPLPEAVLGQLAENAPRANGYLALEPGLSLFSTGGSALSYARSGRTVFAVGGVLGPPDEASAALTSFREAAAAAGHRRVLVFPAAEGECSAFAEAGYDIVQVGSEAFIDPQLFSTTGKHGADLRQMCNRARKRYGLAFEEVAANRGVERERLAQFFDAWRPRLGPVPLRLVLGTPCLERPFQRRYFAVARPGDDLPVAVATLCPGWGGSGWGVDVMARGRGAPAGAMDLLLTQLIRRLGAEGVERVSLGACPMSQKAATERPRHPVLRLGFRFLYHTSLGNQLFRFRGLSHFKSKFNPSWEPVYIAAWPRVTAPTLYAGCRMWGLFGDRAEILA